jgi:hypothetical protein
MGEGSSLVEIVEACAGLRAWPGGDHAGLCRPEGHSPVEIV